MKAALQTCSQLDDHVSINPRVMAGTAGWCHCRALSLEFSHDLSVYHSQPPQAQASERDKLLTHNVQVCSAESSSAAGDLVSASWQCWWGCSGAQEQLCSTLPKLWRSSFSSGKVRESTGACVSELGQLQPGHTAKAVEGGWPWN